MNWRRRYETVRRVGIAQVTMARAWIALRGDDRVHQSLRLRPGDLVIDVGAFEGEFTKLVRSQFDAEVIAVEPVPEFASTLREVFSDDPAVEVVTAALGGTSGTTTLHTAADGTSAWVGGESSIDVPLLDVSDLVGGRSVVLLKINAEGAEFDVLTRLVTTGQIRQIDSILVQFHKFVPGAPAKRKTLRRQLRQTHRCALNLPWVWELWRLS